MISLLRRGKKRNNSAVSRRININLDSALEHVPRFSFVGNRADQYDNVWHAGMLM